MIGKRLLNDGWSFTKMPVGSTREQALKADWKRVQLPHDWLIWQTENLYESADAWYSRKLSWQDAKAPCILLRFNGVYMDCDVLLNGEIVCSHAYGYTSFDADLSGKLLPGENELMVHIRHRSPNSRWYSGSGIYRDVILNCLPQSHIVPDSLYTITTRLSEGWLVQAEVEIIGSGQVECSIIEETTGAIVASGSSSSVEGKAIVQLMVQEGKTWDIDHPFLYILCCRMGEQEERCRIGLREIEFNPASGFWINGKNIKFRGVCNHHDLGALGSAFHIEAARRQLKILQDMGVNALRTSHNPPDPQLLDLCDSMGILVIDEILDMWERPKTEYDYARFFDECEADDIASWVRRDRNHPCVVMWSIGNEIYDMHADRRGREVCQMLTEQTRSHDPKGHAAVTFGSNYMPWEGAQHCAEIVKIAGYNYAENHYANHHAVHPDWVIYGSETSSILSSRSIYHFPLSKTILSDADLQCSSLGNSTTSWGARDLGRIIIEDLNTSYTMGQFIWSGFDYIGEPTPYHTRSSYFGQIDTAGFPKDSFFLIKSLWTDAPMIHLGIYWDWNTTQLIDVRVMSNCPNVELRINGRSIGQKKLERHSVDQYMAVWQVPYERGMLEAIGYDAAGREVCRDFRKSFGDTKKLNIQAEKCFLKSDGHDITFLTIQALDENDTNVDNARDRIHVKVTGGGVLLGMDNGDSSDADGYKTNNRRLFGGKLLLIIGSNGKKEPTFVEAQTCNGIKATFKIPVISCRKIADGELNAVPEKPEKKQIAVRRIEIIPTNGCKLCPEQKEARFMWRYWPRNADPVKICWQVTTLTGIISPSAKVVEEGDSVRVIAKGDGDVYLRALYGNADDEHPEQISQIELQITGMGSTDIDPYSFVSAGLYDISSGDIGAGNEKGIAFAREGGESLIGFSRVNFGDPGSDQVELYLFTLNDEEYKIRLYDGIPGNGGVLLTELYYQEQSIWNVYQPKSFTLPHRLSGVRTICFSAERKFHFKGFKFEKQSKAYIWHNAGEADSLYGDSFQRFETSVRKIGNNVSIIWEGMDFEEGGVRNLLIRGQTPLEMNAITIKIENQQNENVQEVLNFKGSGKREQIFSFSVPEGICQVSFIFLPGSKFDFEGFRFSY